MTTIGRAIASIRAAYDAAAVIDAESVARLADAHGVGEATAWCAVHGLDEDRIRGLGAGWRGADDETRRHWSRLLEFVWDATTRGAFNAGDEGALAGLEATHRLPAGLLLAGAEGVEGADLDRLAADCMEG